jgi:hypothetical protein
LPPPRLNSPTSAALSFAHDRRPHPLPQEAFYEKEITIADRELMETGTDAILSAAKAGSASVLVVGDPFCATTHSDLCLRANELGIKVEVIHNASIMSAIGACGLQMCVERGLEESGLRRGRAEAGESGLRRGRRGERERKGRREGEIR